MTRTRLQLNDKEMFVATIMREALTDDGYLILNSTNIEFITRVATEIKRNDETFPHELFLGVVIPT